MKNITDLGRIRMDYFEKPKAKWIVVLFVAAIALGWFTETPLHWSFLWFFAGLVGLSAKVHGNRYTDEEMRKIVRDEIRKSLNLKI